jgi:LmbE family N-acetylglucosaminyl deacetylase
MTERPRKTIVAVGAHMDDCWLGMGAFALKAVAAGHRVVMVQVVGRYRTWPTVRGRAAEIKPQLQDLADRTGVELITLDHDYLRLEARPDLMAELSEILEDLAPDILFYQWEDDSNQDHVALGTATRVVGNHRHCFLEDAPRPRPREIYAYAADTQAKNFHPDTFVDVGDVLFDVLRQCRVFDEIYAGDSGAEVTISTLTDHTLGEEVHLTPHTEQKWSLCRLYGLAAGVRYAEGFWAYKRAPVSDSLAI